MRILFNRLILALILLCANISAQQQTYDKIKAMSDSVSTPNIQRHIRGLEYAGGHHSRVTLTAGNDSARAYIKRSLDSIPGLLVTQDTFFHTTAPSPYNTKPFINVIATIPGASQSSVYYVIGAHYDNSASRMGTTVWNQQWQTIAAPGGDDNATGVAGIIEIARILSDISFGFRPDYTIKLIAFAAEESSPAYTGSHLGSKDYATRAFNRGDQINGMISLDMIGYNPNHLYTGIVSDAASTYLGEKMIAAKNMFNIDLITNTPPFPYATYSDHDQFWAKGYKAILVIENAPPWNNGTYYIANPLYHTSFDSSGSVNLELVRRVVQMNLVTVSSLAARLSAVEEQDIAEGISRLYQNYPNPFSGTTSIRYQIPVGAAQGGSGDRVVLRVFDILGREISVLTDEEKAPGIYDVSFDASGLSSGIYYYQLITSNSTETKKMMVLR